MIEAILTIVAVVVAFVVGKYRGGKNHKQEQQRDYEQTRFRVDGVSRADPADVADRLREHSNKR